MVAQETHDEVAEAVEADVFESEEMPSQSEKWVDFRAVILIALGGIVVIAAAIAIWNTLSAPPAPSETPRPSSPIPLEGSANPEQLQSGGASVQNGSGVDGSDNSASDALQPQDNLTPQQQEDLLR